MKRLLASIVMICVSALICDAQTYRWTDNQGVIHFTDTLESVPHKYRKKVKTGPDITVRDPRIQEEVKQQEQRAIKEEASRPKITPSPPAPAVAPPPPPEASAPPAAKTEEPPPRTKSERIRDNLERRRQEEEKARQSGQTQSY